MNKIQQAQRVLRDLGLPEAQQNEISALTLLALCGIRPRDAWRNSTRKSLTITKGIMSFVQEFFRRQYAPNSRETFRRQVLHQFVQARVADYNPDNPDLPTNSPLAHYAISEPALEAIRAYGSSGWRAACKEFVAQQGSLREEYRKRRKRQSIPVHLSDGEVLALSPGKHNEVQAAVVHKFWPQFAPKAKLLYLGDTANKTLHVDKDKLSELGFALSDHDKLPDIVLYDDAASRLFLIEAVTSHGPASPKRVRELVEMFRKCKAAKVFISAFPNFAEFRKHLKKIAWETEVWIADIPDHLIHYNGERYLQEH